MVHSGFFLGKRRANIPVRLAGRFLAIRNPKSAIENPSVNTACLAEAKRRRVVIFQYKSQ
jgi:hypothetical protein